MLGTVDLNAVISKLKELADVPCYVVQDNNDGGEKIT